MSDRPSSTLKQIERLIELAKANHKGFLLYRLTPDQRIIWDAHRAAIARIVDGPGNCFEDYLNGNNPFAGIELDDEVAEVLGINAEPIGIPIDATDDEASQIYQEYLDDL